MQIPERLASSRCASSAFPPQGSRSSPMPRSSQQASWFDPCRDRLLPLPLHRSKNHETFDDIQRLARRRRQDLSIPITSSSPERSLSPAVRKDSVQSRTDAHKLEPILSTYASANPIMPSIDRSLHNSTRQQSLKRPVSDLGLDSSYEHYDRARRGWSAGEVSPRTTQPLTSCNHKPQLPPTPPADRLFFPRLAIPHLIEPQASQRLTQTSRPGPISSVSKSPSDQAHRANASPTPSNTTQPPDHPAPDSTVMPSHAARRVKYKGIFRTSEAEFYTYEDGSLIPTHVDGEPVNPAWGLTKANRPRKRLPRACRACRDEKSRCEPTRSGCVRCDITGRTCTS